MEQELRTGGGGNLRAAQNSSNDVTLAQQAMWVLNNIASSQGDPSQRLTSWLLRALVARACRLCGPTGTIQAAAGAPAPRERAMSVTELAEYIDLTQWHRFCFTASNSTILRAVAGSAVHIIDLSSWIRHVTPGFRDTFLDIVRTLNPCLVTVTGEDADLDSPSLATRIAGCFDFHWILFDALDTSAPRDSPWRVEHEAAVGRKIESVVRDDDADGAERVESGARLAEQMRRNGFASVGLDEDAAAEVRRLLSEHATGWGVKREEDMLVLTWKGHDASVENRRHAGRHVPNTTHQNSHRV
ncbi:hypothetical protein BDA96_03G417800 [Sorghum bicolor]|uniref:Scarecrow-like protein 32 n=1 Tax=Sorghum bicolor TaxID=4558 RepID=A0A921USY1_SORBI|nr:hypothetical protein BDA96_03G417800 [Sorghum bicolor]